MPDNTAIDTIRQIIVRAGSSDNTKFYPESYVKEVQALITSEKEALLERLKQEHRDTCGATYPKVPRDNCKYEDIVNAELKTLRGDK
jgi:hypothetical protein